MNRRRSLALAASVVGLSLALSGCSAFGNSLDGAVRLDDSATPDGSDLDDDTTTEGSDLDIFSLAVGDCFGDLSDDDVLSSVTAVPCDQAHVYEVFYDFELPDGEYPDDDQVADITWERCDAAFETFVGRAYDDSTLDYTYISPTEESWTNIDDRLVSCVIGSEGVTVTGSAQGSQQ
ncbi:septum formation family protein [Microbacterium sp.]|uniref:septum formation family protein n=1 Tax=Microbacterium sp. TaxID=51671 RepID=UPI0039E2C999